MVNAYFENYGLVLTLLLVGGGGESAPRLVFLLSTENGLTRARPGGTYVPPHRFFADSRKMAARSAAKFGIAVHSSFAHLV